MFLFTHFFLKFSHKTNKLTNKLGSWYCLLFTVIYIPVNYQSIQRLSTMPQSTLDKSSRQHTLFGYHT